MDQDTLELTWPQIELFVDALSKKVQAALQAVGETQFDLIYPERGGMVVAGMLAYKLNVPKGRVGQFLCWDRVCPPAWSKVLLFVDDIADTGREISYAKDILKDYKRIVLTGSLIVRSTCKSYGWPDIYAYILNNNDWVIFPWAPNDGPTVGGSDDGEVHDGGSEVESELSVGPDPADRVGDRDGEIHVGPPTLFGGQLEEGHSIQESSQPSGEPPSEREEPAPREET